MMYHLRLLVFFAFIAVVPVYLREAPPVLQICKEMDRRLGVITDKKQPFKVCDTLIRLLPGEALLVPKNPPCPTNLYDVQFTGSLKDPISNAVVSTELLYENQRLYTVEKKIIPNGFLNNYLDITRSLQMAEDVDTGKNLLSVACKVSDPALKNTLLRAISLMYPDLDCNCSSIY